MLKFNKKVEEKAQAQGWNIEEIHKLLDYCDYEELQDMEAIGVDENYIYFSDTYDIMKLDAQGELTLIEDDMYYDKGYVKDSKGNIRFEYLGGEE